MSGLSLQRSRSIAGRNIGIAVFFGRSVRSSLMKAVRRFLWLPHPVAEHYKLLCFAQVTEVDWSFDEIVNHEWYLTIRYRPRLRMKFPHKNQTLLSVLFSPFSLTVCFQSTVKGDVCKLLLRI